VALEHELLARHTGHRVQHARIAYPQPPELPDHLLARDHHAHMMARSRRSSLLDGYADQASPLGPGAVVVADLVMAEQVAQHEPGVGAPLADAAVRDDLTASGQALSLVDRPKLVGVLEASVFGDGRGPRNVLRAGDVTTALRALLWKILRREQLARVLLRGADVDDLRATIRHALEHQVPQGAHRRVRRLRPIVAPRERWRRVRQGSTLCDPLRASTVHEAHVLVAVVLEEPEEPCREPIVVVAIDRDGRIRGRA